MTPISCRCKYPYMRGGLPFGCGQCMPCRIKRRRIWVHRNMLESRLHGDSSFLTLTYNEESHAELKNGSLDFSHHTKFLKKLRRRYTTNPIRFYGVGEYGERYSRAHFHYLLYGYPTCTGTQCTQKKPVRCPACHLVWSTWGKGNILLGDVTKDSITYVAGYVTKGWTHENEYNRTKLNGRTPESARMSTAIGGKAIDSIATTFQRDIEFSETFLGHYGDVPSIVRTEQREYPLGRYLRSRFRKNLGWSETGLPSDKLNEWKKEMQKLYAEHFKDAPFTPQDFNKKTLLTHLNKDAITIIENRFKIFNLAGAL